MDELFKSIGVAEENFNGIKDIMKEFMQSFDEIKDTMSDIIGIAEQTNLLALNAYIEAVLNNSMDGTYKVLYNSNKQVDNAKTVIQEIDGYVGDVTNVKEKIVSAVDKCDNNFEGVL